MSASADPINPDIDRMSDCGNVHIMVFIVLYSVRFDFYNSPAPAGRLLDALRSKR
jgi:hypothetical protein